MHSYREDSKKSRHTKLKSMVGYHAAGAYPGSQSTKMPPPIEGSKKGVEAPEENLTDPSLPYPYPKKFANGGSVMGEEPSSRLDRPSRSRKKKDGDTNVTIVVAGGAKPQQPGAVVAPSPLASAPPAAPPMPPPPMPPPGPMGAKPPMPPMGPGGMPTPIPNRPFKRGGAVKKHGDEAEDRKLFNKMMKAHEKKEGEPVKKASGGFIKPVKPGKQPTGGGEGGRARLQKAAEAKKNRLG